MSKKKTRKLGYILTSIIYFFALTLFVIGNWCKNTFTVGLQEILFTLKSPLKGTDTSIITDGINKCLPPIIIGTILFILFVIIINKNSISIKLSIRILKAKISFDIITFLKRSIVFITILSLIFSLAYIEEHFKITTYIKNKMHPTHIYEEYYVHPDSVNIRADGDEKNIICIYLESMETTYASSEVGGNQPVNYIPNLTNLANENLSFSNSDKLGGFKIVEGTYWTTGALMALTAGVPFAFPMEGSSMNLRETFASGLVTFGDILNRFNYNQFFLCGSDADFGGRKAYFEQHGGYNIIDLYTARSNNYISPDYNVWWGFEDMHLYEIAKEELTEISASNEPFNFTMLTVDTHGIGGYICELCGDDYAVDTANIVLCADKQLNEFIKWCQEQPFYENTAIVIAGDHPRSDLRLTEDIPREERTVYNCFINCGEHPETNTQNREFTAMDMFPTTLSAMGFEYDGARIGLGTNLFSNEPTLAETLGLYDFRQELVKYSKYYIDNFS